RPRGPGAAALPRGSCPMKDATRGAARSGHERTGAVDLPHRMRVSASGSKAGPQPPAPREVQMDADRSGRLRPGRTAGGLRLVEGRQPVQVPDLLRPERSNLAGPDAIQANRSDPDPPRRRD